MSRIIAWAMVALLAIAVACSPAEPEVKDESAPVVDKEATREEVLDLPPPADPGQTK